MADREKSGASRATIVVALIGLVSAIAVIGKYGPGSFLFSCPICPPPPCANIAGTYRSNNGETVVTTQKECAVQSEIQDSGHATIAIDIVGQMKVDYGQYTVTLTDNNQNCTVLFYGVITDITPVSYESHVFKTDGSCKVPPDWHQNLVWRRWGS